MYRVRLKLKTTSSDEGIIYKRFNLIAKIHNNLVSYAEKRLRMLMRDKEYKQALEGYRAALKAEDEDSRVAYGKKLEERKKFYGLTKSALEKYVSVDQKKYAQHLSSHQCQKEAERVYNGVKSVIYGNGEEIHFKKKSKFNTIGGKSPTNGVRLYTRVHTDFLPKTMVKPSFDCIEWLGLLIPVELDWDDPYIGKAMNNPDVSYCEISRLEFSDGWHYYVNIYFEGCAPKKVQPGVGRMGIDPGVSTMATVSRNALFLEELAPEVIRYNKKIAKLQRQIDASKRKSNPENYNADGTCKKGKLKWVYTKTCLRKMRMLRVLYRKRAAYMKQSHEELIKQIIQKADIFIVEHMIYKALAKRAKNTERQDKVSEVKNKRGEIKKVRKFKRKRRFGKSLNNRAPSKFLTILKTKCTQYELSYAETDTRSFKASQFNHSSGEYIPASLNTRFKEIGGHIVQRDLYSAFLIFCSNNTYDAPDITLCNRYYDEFVQSHDSLIADMQNRNISMKQCFGF